MTAIRGVLFDTGDTLLRPIGGRWNPRFDFEDVLLRHVPDVPAGRFPAAFAAGEQFLDAAVGTPPRDDYHRAVLSTLGIDDPSPALLSELSRPLDAPVLEPFPEVRDVLRSLQQRSIAMAIVSDSWPGQERTYEKLGLRDYFGVFVISAVLGVNKPDPRMYTAASDGLGLPAAECLFVDDDPDLVDAAIQLGYQGVTICRDGSSTALTPSVSNLLELLDMI